jgi:hypothetical protein
MRFLLAAAAVSIAAGTACNAKGPPCGPEETCARGCESRDKACTREECWRGCNLVLDRLAEHEGDHVLACVATAASAASAAKAAAPCDDRVWARCAVRVGAHADGGPPAPSPPRDFEDEE